MTVGQLAANAESPLLERLGRYVSLLKIRPMSAVIYAAIIGYLCAPVSAGVLVGIGAILCIALGGGGAAALNMWFEADVDARMARTRRRVLVSGRMQAPKALVFGSALCVGSALSMWAIAGPAAALMLCATMGAYFGLYTVALKRWTPHSVTIGGALAGVLTPLTGWVSATGSLDGSALVLFAFVFFWTPPHVWSQASFRVRDYARAGVPMMPVHAGQRSTARWILAYTLVHSLAALLPVALGEATWAYGALAFSGGAVLSSAAYRMHRAIADNEIEARSRPFFRLSITYLMILLTALAVDRAFLL